VVVMWLVVVVVVVSAVSAAAGYVLLDPRGDTTGALAQAFAAGALLAMLTDTLLPEACEVLNPRRPRCRDLGAGWPPRPPATPPT
jgi:ZIP family zinc transporter